MNCFLKYVIISLVIFICSCNTTGNKIEEEEKEALKDSLIEIDSIPSGITENLTYEEVYDRALALWKVPFQQMKLKTTYGTAHVFVSGPVDAPVLVLLHGMNASSAMWYPNIEALSKGYRIYAIDFLMEPGRSVCEGEINDTKQIVNWYYEIFDQLKLKKFSLLGASRGGWLAVNIALHSPERINKMALLSPAQTFIWIRPGAKIMENVLYTISPKRKRLRSVLETMTSNIENIEQDYINLYFLSTKKASVNKCFLQMRPFSEKELKSLHMPILVLIGDKDIINNAKSLDIARTTFSNGKSEIIENAGHFLSVDQATVVNEKVLIFLK
ncbi:MAG: alpha/beta hydrolase [Bacteroidia bacterium]|nr:alpha/beta hydrolase [Bacteroidia bacterium]